MNDEYYQLIIKSLLKMIENDLLPSCKLIYSTGCGCHSIEETDKLFKLYDDLTKGIRNALGDALND